MGLTGVALRTWRDGRRGGTVVGRRQQQRLTDLVEHARTRSPFYRRWYAGVPEGQLDLRQLPPVEKPQLMAAFDDWVTDPRVRQCDLEAFAAEPENVGRLFLDRYLVFITSGTTGEPALLLQDRPMMEVLTALSIVRTAAPMLKSRGVVGRVLRSGGRSASLWATGRPFGGASLVQRQIRRRPSRAKRIRIFSASSPLDELVTQLNDFRPGMLSGYASVLALLAGEQLAGRLRIEPGLINNGGETLTTAQRALITTAFDAPVFNGYGCSEMLMIGFDCGHGSMHLHADWLVLEPVDSAFQPTPPGQPSSTVLLTNLANQVQPIIRYNLGDSVLLQQRPCPCGRPLPAVEVVGRTNDLVSFDSGRGAVDLAPLPLVTVAEAVPGVRSIQLVQPDRHSLVVRFDELPGQQRGIVGDDIASQLRRHLARHRLGAVAVAVSRERPLRDPTSGKLRQVVVEPKDPTEPLD